jgi:hypothetical protein
VRTLVPLIAAAALLPIGTAAAAPAARTLTFTELLHKTIPVKGPFGSQLGTSAVVVDGGDNALASYPLLNEASVSAIEVTPWRRQFVVAVFSLFPTRGYDVAVRRIKVQQIGGGLEQLCIIAAVKAPAPGRVVLQERTSVYDVVRVTREAAGAPAPHAAVVRSPQGKLLDWTRDGRPVRPKVCRAA